MTVSIPKQSITGRLQISSLAGTIRIPRQGWGGTLFNDVPTLLNATIRTPMFGLAGVLDNPPTLKLEEAEGAGGRTLLIATRPGAPYETVGARTVVRPSEVLGLSRFSVTDAAGLRAAYELGKRDGEVFARRLLNDAP